MHTGLNEIENLVDEKNRKIYSLNDGSLNETGYQVVYVKNEKNYR